MRIGQCETNQVQGLQLFGSSHGKTSQGFLDFFWDALLGGKGLGAEPLQEISSEAAVRLDPRSLVEFSSKTRECSGVCLTEPSLEANIEKGSFPAAASGPKCQSILPHHPRVMEDDGFSPPSAQTLSHESEQSVPHGGQEIDVGPQGLPGTVILCASHTFSKDASSLEVKQTGDVDLFADTGSRQGQKMSFFMGNVEDGSYPGFLVSLDQLQIQANESLEGINDRQSYFFQLGQASGTTGKKAFGFVQSQGKDPVNSGYFLAGSSRQFRLQQGLVVDFEDKALEGAASASRDPRRSANLQPDVQDALNGEPALHTASGKSFDKSLPIWFVSPSLRGTFQAQERPTGKLGANSGHGSWSLASGAAPQEQEEGSFGNDPQGSVILPPKLHLSREGMWRGSASEEFQLKAGSSQPLGFSHLGALAQGSAGQEASEQVQVAAQFSGESQDFFPDAPGAKPFGEATTSVFGTALKAGVEPEQFKDQKVVHIQMEPPDLGLLRVRLKVHKEGLEALFLTQGPEQKAALEQGLSQLRQSLAEQGFLSQRLAVDIGGGGAQWMSQPKTHPGLCAGTQSLETRETSERNQELCEVHREHGKLHLRV